MLRQFFLLLAVFSLAATSRAQSPTASPTSRPAAEWSKLPPAQWPQLVLTNDASFDGHSPLHGASAFLMKMPDGEVLLGTAKHLIKKPGGVDPPIALPDLDHVLTEWKVFPRTHDDQFLKAKGVAERTNGEGLHDWLMLHLLNPPSTLPATPLIPRTDPVQPGEKIFLVGVSYDDRASAQNVYEGVVTARPKPNYFTYDFKPAVHINGFSGAPIVDANGLLVGHGVSKSSALKQENGLEVEFGGEDASLALELWRHRNDPPTTRAADALHLNLPEGWVAKTPKPEKALKYAEYPASTAYCELSAEPKSDFTESTDLMHWASLCKVATAKASRLDNRQETELQASRIGARPTVEYEITGEIKGVKLHYRVIMLECNGLFCKFTCWTTPSHWDDAQSRFDDFVEALK